MFHFAQTGKAANVCTIKKGNHPIKRDNPPIKRDNYPVERDNHPVERDNHPIKRDKLHALHDSRKRLCASWRGSLSIYYLILIRASTASQWFQMIWNRRIQLVDQNLFPISSGVSEWASEGTNERSEGREQSEQCGASEWVSGASERANRGANGPVLYALIS